MNGGVSQQARVMASVKAYRAWRSAGGMVAVYPAHELPIDADTLEEACAQASTKVMPKDMLMVQEIDAVRRTNRVHFFLIQEGQPAWRKNAQTGLSERYRPMKAKPLHVVPFDAFEPARPFDTMRDDPTGFDQTLVEDAA